MNEMLEQLKIDPEFEKVIPPLTKDEYHQLEENILDDGRIMMPIAVWGDIIVDGHNRYRIAREYGDISFSTTQLDFANRYEAIAWICKNQLGRRNLSDEQKAYLLGKPTVFTTLLFNLLLCGIAFAKQICFLLIAQIAPAKLVFAYPSNRLVTIGKGKLRG